MLIKIKTFDTNTHMMRNINFEGVGGVKMKISMKNE